MIDESSILIRKLATANRRKPVPVLVSVESGHLRPHTVVYGRVRIPERLSMMIDDQHPRCSSDEEVVQGHNCCEIPPVLVLLESVSTYQYIANGGSLWH